MNVHNLAVRVTKKEKGKRTLGIGQAKEVIKLTMIELANNDQLDTLKTLLRYRKKK